MYPALTRSSSARRTVLMDSFVSLLIVRTEGKHFPSLSARLRRYMYTVTARLGRSSAQIVSNQPLTRSPASAPASAAPGTAPAPVQSAAPAGYRTLSIWIGNPLKLSPDFPPIHTVRATFTAHGVPSLVNRCNFNLFA